MADIEGQDRVCTFVRAIMSTRVGEPLEIVARPDEDERNDKAVEELWDSGSHRFAIEHTRIESFDGQIANLKTIERLLVQVKDALRGQVPDRFVLAASRVIGWSS